MGNCKHAGLDMRMWEFGCRSLLKEYGRLFTCQIALRHPWRLLRGWVDYQRLIVPHLYEDDLLRLFEDSPEDFIRDTVGTGEALLFAPGFCQKPMPGNGQPHQCPAGRPNHSCALIERMSAPEDLEANLPPACRICVIRDYASLALRSGSHIYIMTSAKDIAEDVFVPAMERGLFRRGIFLLCAYSHRPFALGALICGLCCILARFAEGDCRTYETWRAADLGVKNEQTMLTPDMLARVNALLSLAAVERASAGLPAGKGFERVGNIYVAKTE